MQNQIDFKQERSILRWGGLSGMTGAGLFIIVIVYLGIFLPPEPGDLVRFVTRFPEIKTIRVIENIIYLTGLLLEIPLILAVYHALRKTRSAAVVFGCVFCILGILSMAVSATPHVVHNSLYVLYNTAEATAADQAVIAILWQTVWEIFYAMLYVGFFIVSLGFLVLGIGLQKTTVFSRWIGILVTIFGFLGLTSAILQIVEPGSDAGAGSFFAGIFTYFILGWQVFRLSRSSDKSKG